MRARAVVSLGGEQTWILGHGDLIGRLWTAALHVDDPRVSEAHAMVSLREGSLRLLALRRRFAVGGSPTSEVELAVGVEISLADGVTLHVLDVALPDEALAIEGDGLPRQMLQGVCSLFAGPRPTLAPGYEGDANAWLWADGERWRLRLRDTDPTNLRAGDTFRIDGREFRAVAMATESQSATRAEGGVDGPLRIAAWYDSVQISRAGGPPTVIGGIPARIISELVAFGGPTNWEVVAGEVWRDTDPVRLRRLWDVNLSRLRARLRASGVRADLVQSSGAGQVQLLVHANDVVDDHT